MANLTKEIMSDTTYCQLGLRIGPKRLDAMIYNPMEDNSLVHESFDIAVVDPMKSLEEIIYENPLLLSEFQKVAIVTESHDFTVVPSAISDDALRRSMLIKAHPEADDGYEMIVNDVKNLGVSFLTALTAKQLSFLRRTFDNAPIHLNISLLARYFSLQIPRGGTVRLYINLRPSSAEVLVVGHNSLLLANRFAYREVSDLVYYVVTAVKILEIPMPEILVSGIREGRDELLSQLRDFCPTVMPTIFPSTMYRAGRQSINVPFDLIILPLCE